MAMRLPNWLYAWAMRHYEASLVYGPTWFMRSRFWLPVLLVLILFGWAVATLLGWLGVLPARREF